MADNQAPLTVVDIDDASTGFIREAGGRVANQTEFYHVHMPVGTLKRKRDGVKLFVLPTGVKITYEPYRLFYDEDMQSAS